MKKYLGMLLLVATLGMMAYQVGRPIDLYADDLVSLDWEPMPAGDSVRFVATFTAPADADSVAIRWTLGTTNVYHTLTAPYASADTVRFGGIVPGYSATGSFRAYVWKGGLSSNGVTKSYNVIIPAPTPPSDITGLALADSAVVY